MKMILTKKEIMDTLKKGQILINLFDKESIGPASYDIKLDKIIRTFTKKRLIDSRKFDFESITKRKDISNGFVLKPGELILGQTFESIKLPNNIVGLIQSRSSFARIGLMSHITAPYIWPTSKGKQVLEIFNAGKNPIKLWPGIKIGQIVFEKVKGKTVYNGRFKEQRM